MNRWVLRVLPGSYALRFALWAAIGFLGLSFILTFFPGSLMWSYRSLIGAAFFALVAATSLKLRSNRRNNHEKELLKKILQSSSAGVQVGERILRQGDSLIDALASFSRETRLSIGVTNRSVVALRQDFGEVQERSAASIVESVEVNAYASLLSAQKLQRDLISSGFSIAQSRSSEQ